MIAPNAHQQPLAHRPQHLWGGEQRTAGVTVQKFGSESSFAQNVHEANASSDISAVKSVNGEDEELSFFDFIKGVVDIVNPLQHIPVISTIYRNITGDDLSPMARVAGGALFGGPLGAVMSLASAATEANTGKDLTETALSFFAGQGDAPTAPMSSDTMVASNTSFDNRIIWNDEKQNSNSPSVHPTSYHTGTDGNKQPVKHSLPYTMPVAQKESRPDTPTGLTAVAENHVEKKSSSSVSVSHRPVLDMQEAPVRETGRKPVPPELIAIQMMDGLDKYAAMKKYDFQNQSMAPAQHVALSE